MRPFVILLTLTGIGGIAVLTIFGVLIDGGFSPYNEGIILTKFSDYQLQKYQEENSQYLNLVKITDEDLAKVPAVKKLIEDSLQKEFPKNRTGQVLSDIDTLMKNHNYYAEILAKKYFKNPNEFFIRYDVEPEVLEEYPDAVRVDFQARYFEFDGEQYGYRSTRTYLNYGDDLAMIEAYKVNSPLDPSRHTWAELTEEDLENMPTLKEAINNIEKFEENIRVQTGLSNAEINSIQEWNEGLGFGSNRATVVGSLMEYDGQYYQIGFWIAYIMKTRNKLILIAAILISGFIIMPTTITLGSTFYCNSIYPVECMSFSISLIPNFRPFVDTVLDKEEGQRQYDTTPATCNDIFGKPDGECFVKAFEKCEHASIKNIVHTIEGDPVFLYASIDVDDCQLGFHTDQRLDRFSSQVDQTFHSEICTKVELDEYKLTFLCNNEQRFLSLR